MSAKPKLGLKTLDEFRENSEANYETLPRFTTREYQDPSPFPQRSDRWYNGSLIGVGGKDPSLFGPKGRLRSLHMKITSQETPGIQARGQLYRLAGNILCQFFSCAILDPLIEDLIACNTVRLPKAMDEAICVVLAAVEMLLRRFHRTVLKEGVVAEIANKLGIEISRQKLIAAKWFLAKGGFWREHLHEINTATYEILQNLTLDIIANFSFLVKNNLGRFRRQVYRR
ncbi:MAG: hypothetical protein ACFFB3_06820 [Candidatus Hodarchaeota archaeon]